MKKNIAADSDNMQNNKPAAAIGVQEKLSVNVRKSSSTVVNPLTRVNDPTKNSEAAAGSSSSNEGRRMSVIVTANRGNSNMDPPATPNVYSSTTVQKKDAAEPSQILVPHEMLKVINQIQTDRQMQIDDSRIQIARRQLHDPREMPPSNQLQTAAAAGQSNYQMEQRRKKEDHTTTHHQMLTDRQMLIDSEMYNVESFNNNTADGQIPSTSTGNYQFSFITGIFYYFYLCIYIYF